MSRRTRGTWSVLIGGIMLGGAMIGGVSADGEPAQDVGELREAAIRPPIVLTERARQLHQSLWVFDGHNDLPWAVRTKAGGSFDQADIAQPQPRFHTDIPRLRAGNVGAQFWSVYVPAETRHRGQAAQQMLEQIALIRQMAARYPEVFALAETADEVERIRGEGKIASLLGVEGGHAIENSLTMLARYRQMGVRYMTLTHNDTLDWADAATDQARHGGLTPFGREVVAEMNRLGILVDISHVSPDTMRAVLRMTTAPVIASHSSARAVTDHPRNIPDDVLRQMPQNGGVVMVNFSSGFLVQRGAEIMKEYTGVRRALREQHPDDGEYSAALARWRQQNPLPTGSVHDVLDHIDHIVKTAGIAHVGLGSDFDGVTTLPRQLEDVAGYPVITQGLLDRGYDEQAIRAILHGNALRVLRAAERP